LYAASKVTKAFGALAVAGFAIGVWDNVVNYKHGLARTIIDIGVFGGCALIGVGLATIGAPVVLGAALSIGGAALLTTGGNAIKKTWFNDPKN
jgi:hypothetical protein